MYYMFYETLFFLHNTKGDRF